MALGAALARCCSKIARCRWVSLRLGLVVHYQATNLIVPIWVNAENETHGLDTSQPGEMVLVA